MSIDTTRILAKARHLWWQWNTFLDAAFGHPRRTVRYRLAFKYRLSSSVQYRGREGMSESHEGFHSFKKAQGVYKADLAFFQDYERVESFAICLNYDSCKKWENPIHAAAHEGTKATTKSPDERGGAKCKACGKRLRWK
jgi:hypothetical protein